MARAPSPSPRQAGKPHRLPLKDPSMQDIIWIAIMLGLLAATLAYVRLCDTI